MDKKLKISSTAYRILLLLLYLNENPYSANQLNEIFSKDEYVARYFSKDVILKYISTLRFAGYKISKPGLANNYSYELNKSPVSANLTENQIKVLAVMDGYVKSFHQIKMVEKYKNFLRKVKKIIPDEQVEALNNELKNQEENPCEDFSRHNDFADLIKKVEHFKEEKCRVMIKYKLFDTKEEKQIVLELKNIKYDKTEVYLSGYNPVVGQTQLIKFGQIVEIRHLPTKSQYGQMLFPVIYKLSGQLAKGYRPYENEKITETSEKTNSITVTAYTEDQDMLLSRLMRYGEYCEVLYPKRARDSIIKMINKTLDNYDCLPEKRH